MITLSFPWLVVLVMLLFLATLVLMACFKSPMRKWVCFGLAFVSIAYLLYIILWQQQNSDQKLDWFLFGCVSVFAALALAGIGFMDMVKPKPVIEIAKNTLYSQQRIMELCSCFLLLNKERSVCAEFAKTVFADTFNNTEISTLEKKIKGKDRMQILIDTYREALSTNVKN